MNMAGRKSKLLKWGKRILLPIVAFHALTQINNWSVNSYYSHFPFRQQFKEIAGFPIRGGVMEIEGLTSANVNELAEIIFKERSERDFSLGDLTIESDNYQDRSFIEQMVGIFGSHYTGWCWGDNIGLKKGNIHGLTHEIKHKKSYEIMNDDPEFLERWMDLSRDEDGDSMYIHHDYFSWASTRSRCIESLVCEDEDSDDLRDGFISGYAKTIIYEDIAELCANVEENPALFNSLLFGEKRNSR